MQAVKRSPVDLRPLLGIHPELNAATVGLALSAYARNGFIAPDEAHAKLGEPTEANDAVAAARSCVPSDFLFMHTALSQATGWAMAASGRLGEAVASVQEAGRLARDRGQPPGRQPVMLYRCVSHAVRDP